MPEKATHNPVVSPPLLLTAFEKKNLNALFALFISVPPGRKVWTALGLGLVNGSALQMPGPEAVYEAGRDPMAPGMDPPIREEFPRIMGL